MLIVSLLSDIENLSRRRLSTPPLEHEQLIHDNTLHVAHRSLALTHAVLELVAVHELAGDTCTGKRDQPGPAQLLIRLWPRVGHRLGVVSHKHLIPRP